MTKAFDTFLEKAHVMVLPTSQLSVGGTLMDYFAWKAPFEGGKKEFLDAFSLRGAISWMESTKADEMALVTSDKGLGTAVGADDRVTLHTSLSSLLDEIYSQDEARASFLKHELIKRRDELKKWAVDVFTDRGFDVEGRFEGEVLELTVDSIDLTDDPDELEIVQLDENSATVVTRVDVEFSAHIKYGDRTTPASTDKEFGPAYWSYIEETVNERREIDFEVQVTFDGLDPDRFQIKKIDFPEKDTILVEAGYDRENRDDRLK